MPFYGELTAQKGADSGKPPCGIKDGKNSCDEKEKEVREFLKDSR